MTLRPFFQSPILVLILALCCASTLGGCATVTRGSQTYFIVETLPSSAQVYTDKFKTSGGKPVFYGCEATPCKISMARRSQFNVMVTKDGYAPFFYVVQKRPHKELIKDKQDREAFRLDTNGDIVSAEQLSPNAGISLTESNPSIVAAAGTAVGAGYTGWLIWSYAASGSITVPAALATGIPGLMTGYGVDLTSGALIDLTPNPMIVKLAPEESAAETQKLKSAFFASRDKKAGR